MRNEIESIKVVILENSLYSPHWDNWRYLVSVRMGKAKGLRAVEVLKARLKGHRNYKKRPESKKRKDGRLITHCQDFNYSSRNGEV